MWLSDFLTYLFVILVSISPIAVPIGLFFLWRRSKKTQEEARVHWRPPANYNPNPESLADIIPLLEYKKKYAYGLLTFYHVGVNVNRAKEFVAEMERMIEGIGTSDKTSSEVGQEVSRAFHSRFLGPIWPAQFTDEAQHIKDYFNLLIAYRDAWFLENMPPEAERNVAGFRTTDVAQPVHVQIHWSGADEATGKEAIRKFVERHAKEMKRYAGTGALHLVSRATGLRIHKVWLKELPPESPPPPKDAVEIAPGVGITARERHVYLLGKSGQGKSTLMVNMARQDIEAGKGVVFIDPHGEEAPKLLRYIPPERVNDTVYFDPRTTPIGLSTLSGATEEEKALVSDDWMVLFKRLSPDSWGPQLESILWNALYTLVETPGATILDIITLLTDKQWRQETLARIDKPKLANFWENVYESLRNAASPILTRMTLFQLSPFVRNTLGSTSTFNFYDHLQSGGILVANLAGIGEETSHLLGSVLVSQIQFVATRRATLPEEQRTPCYLYVDEFQNFQSSAFGKIIKESRKFKLYLTMGNQMLSDLDPPTYNAIEGVGHSVYFNMTPSDAKRVSSFISKFSLDDFMDLGQGEAIVKPPRARDSFKVTLAMSPAPMHNLADEIIARTREKYAPALRTVDRAPTVDGEPEPSGRPQFTRDDDPQ